MQIPSAGKFAEVNIRHDFLGDKGVVGVVTRVWSGRDVVRSAQHFGEVHSDRFADSRRYGGKGDLLEAFFIDVGGKSDNVRSAEL